MHDLVNSLKTVLAKNHAQLTSSTNSASAVDLAGFESVMFVFNLHAVATADGSNYFTVEVQESDDSSFATGVVTVTSTASRILGTQLVINDTAMAGTVKKFGVTTSIYRYMRLVFTETGTADITVSAIAILGNARHKPVA